METTASFGYWLRRQRKALDLTQGALAERVGCSLAAIKKIEADERRPSLQIAERLADVLAVQVSQRQVFLECARGIRPVDQLLLAHEPAIPAPASSKSPKPSRHNLPAQLTSFIGRKRELDEVQQLLLKARPGARLLTLTGPGGTGKTRLALQIAAEALQAQDFPDGVWLVELAPLADPTLLTQTVAFTLGIRAQPGRPIADTLADYVGSKTMLLILDNCEHLIEPCAHLADALLRLAPRLKILASSREAMGIAGETTYRVPSLPLPDPQQYHDLDALSQNECMRLFVDRAQASYPDFRLKDKNAPTIAEICQRLDGIPLAIELAAARTTIFPPEEIAARLDDRFRLLTGGSRTALERHQTLRALIDWSYDLLSGDEQSLFRQLSVFAGGWSFEAAEQVCSDLDVLNLLTQLVNKSLVIVEQPAQGSRYRLPETIRQYARDKLFESGEAGQVRDRHLEFFLRFAEEAEPRLRGPEQLEWLERVESEHDNLRPALSWSLESKKSEQALQLAGALYYFWEFHGYWIEGHKWLDDALALSEREQIKKVASGETAGLTRAEMALRAKALYAAGRFHFASLLDPRLSRQMVEESLRLWRELGDRWWIAVALEHVGFMLVVEGDIQTSRERLEEGVSLARQLEDRWPLAMCLVRLPSPWMEIDLDVALRIREEGIAVARAVGDKSILCQGLTGLASTYLQIGDLSAAAAFAEEAREQAHAIGSVTHIFLSFMILAIIACLQGDVAKGKRYCFDVLALAREKGALGIPFALFLFALVALFGGESQRGMHLLAAVEALFLQSSFKLVTFGPIGMVFKAAMDMGRSQLGPVAFEAALQEGRTLTPEQALALATEE